MLALLNWVSLFLAQRTNIKLTKETCYKEYWILAMVMSSQFLFTAFQSFETVPYSKREKNEMYDPHPPPPLGLIAARGKGFILQ